MTTMYKVSVDAVEGPTLDGRIHLVNADAPAVPHQTVFPLALLTDAWRLLANGFLRDEGYEERGLDRCPFSPEQGKAIVADMRLNGEYAGFAERLFGTHAVGGYEGEIAMGDPMTFAERAAAIVTRYEIGPYQNVPLLSEVAAMHGPSGLRDATDGPADLRDEAVWDLLWDRTFAEHPYAEITVTVTDPGYLEHLAGGMRWSTAVIGHVR